MRTTSRHALALLGLGLMLTLAACGDDEPPRGVRVVVQSLAADGPVPTPLWVLHAEAESMDERIVLEPVEGVEGLHVAPGAPEGNYTVGASGGWQMLKYGAGLPRLHGRADEQPGAAALGRPYSIYLRAENPTRWRLGETWVVERQVGASPPTWEPVDVPVVQHEAGWTSLRMPPALMTRGSTFRLLGLMSDGTPTSPISVVAPADPRRPYIRFVAPAMSAPLTVRLVPLPGQASIDTRVEASLRGVSLPVRYELDTAAGVGTFHGLAAFAQGLDVHVPAWGDASRYVLGRQRWRQQGGLYLHALPPVEQRRSIRIEGPVAASLRGVATCLRGSETFGWLPVVHGAEGVSVIAPPGAQTWVLRSETGVQVLSLDAVQDALTLDGFGAPARITGSVPAGRAGYRVLFWRRVGEGWAGGADLDVAVDPGGTIEAFLPPGRYRVAIRRPDGRNGRTRDIPQVLLPGSDVEWPFRSEDLH